MFYAKLDASGAVEQYPYTLSDLRRDNPQTSFGRSIDADAAEAFGCVVVTPVDPPTEDHTKNVERSAQQVDGAWQEQWIQTDATADEITERTTYSSNAVRFDRDKRLSECDWTTMTDSPLASDKKTEWATYRQALRDVPGQSGFPFTVTWPTEPS